MSSCLRYSQHVEKDEEGRAFEDNTLCKSVIGAL